VANSFKSFDKIYCINLPSRTDRWNECLCQFRKYEIFHNLQKVDGLIYNNPAFNRKQNAQLGCWFSHYNVLKNAQKSNFTKILILEDDFVFNFEPEHLNLKLFSCINELPQNWDLFYLGAYFVKGYDYEAKTNYSKNLYKANTAFTTHAICYSKDGLNKVVFEMEKLFQSLLSTLENYDGLDWFYAKEFLHKNNCYASKEFLCGQKNGFSDIENCIVDYKNSFAQGYKL